MIRIEMKNCNMILSEKHKKYQLYYQVKLINLNIFQVMEYSFPIKDK